MTRKTAIQTAKDYVDTQFRNYTGKDMVNQADWILAEISKMLDGLIPEERCTLEETYTAGVVEGIGRYKNIGTGRPVTLAAGYYAENFTKGKIKK